MGMRVKQTIIGFFCLLLLMCSATAYDLSPSTISSSVPGWLIANDGADQAVITVEVLDAGIPPSSPTPISNANVTFYLHPGSADLGTITPALPVSVMTGPDGKATAVFKTATKSGTAVINATISVLDGGMPNSISVSTLQRIDHYTPQFATFSHSETLPVGSVTQATVTITDRYGNLIDNKNVAETVRLTMSDEGDAGLWDGSDYIAQRTYTTDAYGNVTADLRISSSIQSNLIQMDPIGNMVIGPHTYIDGVSESEPHFIEQELKSLASLPADGEPENAAEIYYTVTDRFNNPILGATVNFISTDGMSFSTPTNKWGKIRVSFGPKDTIGFYTLTASTPGNASVLCKNDGFTGSCNQIIEYYNTDPVDLTFTANPQSMTSLDVNPSTRSILQARVIDMKGNPVIGEVVTFALETPTYPGGPYDETTAPSLSAPSAPVGAGGYATVQFSPGAFSTSGAGYNATATGQVRAVASWTDRSGNPINRDVTLVWKNYPYISTSSLGDCGNSQVGDKINITIQLYGDGAALRPKPIDAIMVMDVSGSMGPSYSWMAGPLGSQPKIEYSRYAGQIFVGKMDISKDRIGLVTYESSASLLNSLSMDFAGVNANLAAMVPLSGTNQREGTFVALENMIANPKAGAVRAIIVMTDGQYNTWGDPLARGSGSTSLPHSSSTTGYYIIPSLATQNLSRYALDNEIKIYTVTFGTDAKIQPGEPLYKTMTAIATITGGEHFHATDGYQLTDVYETIAGKLQETAGGETVVGLDFGTMKINDDPLLNIGDYMDYVYIPGESTLINKSHTSSFGVYTQQLLETKDHRGEWGSDKKITLDVGTIKLNETWRATFQMELTQAGKIDLFGPDSSAISFTDAATGTTQTGFIPAMQCRVRDSIVDTGFGTKSLFVDNLTFVASPSADTWTIKWNTTYDGDKTVEEVVFYRIAGDPQWKTVPSGMFFKTGQRFEESTPFTFSTSDTSLWPAGKCFQIQVVAGAVDANAARTDSITKCKDLPADTVFIKLE